MILDKEESVKVTAEYGVVLKKAALEAKSVPYEKILAVFETDEPLDANDDLISFGPSFGQEALDEFIRRLSELGLEYYDDFFVLVCDVPFWIEMHVRLI